MLGQTLRTWKRRRICMASALALALLAVGPAFRVDASSNSASNTWTFYSYWQGANAGAWYVWTEQDNISASYSVVGANTGAPTIYVTPTTIGYDISANYIYQYPFPFYQAGHHVDYRNSAGTVQQSAPQSAFYSISSVCNAGDQCPAWRTNNTYVINGSSGSARYYQTIWNGSQTTTSDAGTSNVTVGV